MDKATLVRIHRAQEVLFLRTPYLFSAHQGYLAQFLLAGGTVAVAIDEYFLRRILAVHKYFIHQILNSCQQGAFFPEQQIAVWTIEVENQARLVQHRMDFQAHPHSPQKVNDEIVGFSLDLAKTAQIG